MKKQIISTITAGYLGLSGCIVEQNIKPSRLLPTTSSVTLYKSDFKPRIEELFKNIQYPTCNEVLPLTNQNICLDTITLSSNEHFKINELFNALYKNIETGIHLPYTDKRKEIYKAELELLRIIQDNISLQSILASHLTEHEMDILFQLLLMKSKTIFEIEHLLTRSPLPSPKDIVQEQKESLGYISDKFQKLFPKDSLFPYTDASVKSLYYTPRNNIKQDSFAGYHEPFLQNIININREQMQNGFGDAQIPSTNLQRALLSHELSHSYFNRNFRQHIGPTLSYMTDDLLSEIDAIDELFAACIASYDEPIETQIIHIFFVAPGHQATYRYMNKYIYQAFIDRLYTKIQREQSSTITRNELEKRLLNYSHEPLLTFTKKYFSTIELNDLFKDAANNGHTHLLSVLKSISIEQQLFQVRELYFQKGYDVITEATRPTPHQ